MGDRMIAVFALDLPAQFGVNFGIDMMVRDNAVGSDDFTKRGRPLK